MKKKLVLTGLMLVVVAGAALVVFRSISAQESSAESRSVSRRAAQSLQNKIDDIHKIETSGDSLHRDNEVEVNEAELESYVLFELRDKIPAQLDNLNVQLT